MLRTNVTDTKPTDEPPFPRSVAEAIAKEAKITDPADKAALIARLDDLATYFRDVASNMPSDFDRFSPFDATLTHRVNWLDTEVLNPLKRLIEAVKPENRAWFSMWPHDVVDELKPDFDTIREQLEALRLLAQNTVINLVVHRRTGLPYNEFLRFRLVSSLAAILDDVAPALKPSRGTYSKERGEFIGRYPAIIRMAFEAITGKSDSLDRLLKELVDTRRKK